MGKRFALGGAIVIVLTAVSVAAAALLEINQDLDDAFPEESTIYVPDEVLPDVPTDKPQTILVLGSDRRYGDKTKGLIPRSDSMLLVRLDPEKKAMAVMSIPRDLDVSIPGHRRGRINSAFGTGGPQLSAKTVKALGFRVNQIVNVNFGGFQRGIKRIGCVYIDVDRRYFNDNHPPVQSNENYATIDLQAGYQRMCGKDSLEYVRFRHLDDDFVRAARQQDFVRQLKTQVGVGKLFSDRRELLKIFGRYTQTTIAKRSNARKYGFIKLVIEASKNPVTEVRFPGENQSDGSVSISPGALGRTIRAFEAVKGTARNAGRKGSRPKRAPRRKGLASGLVAAKRQGEDHVLNITTKLQRRLPVYFPAARLSRGGYATSGSPHSYTIRDRARKPHMAYRLVLYEGHPGQYYGVQGTTWDKPPIVADPTDSVRMRRRTYQRYFDGKRIRLIAWRSGGAWYWVSNTLSKALSNPQMMDIARSLQRVGQ